MRWIVAPFALAALAVPCSLAAAEPDPDLRWALCPLDNKAPIRPYAAAGTLEAGALQVTADEGEFRESGVSSFTGSVEVIHDDQALRAERLTYDRESERLGFLGGARYWDSSVFWEGAKGDFDLNARSGELTDGRYQLLGSRGFGAARTIDVDLRKNITKLQDVSFTTCPQPDPAWRFTASRIKLDHDADWGNARNVTISVKGVPVFYSPYMSFPLSDKRKSGFLPPTFGSSADSGFDVALPYYWNIAPEYDATLAPRLLGDRGAMLDAQFRYLVEAGTGTVEGEYMPSDDQFAGGNSRHYLNIRHSQYFSGGRGSAVVLFNHVSDKEYFEDFGNSLSESSTRFLEQRIDVSYNAGWWYGLVRVHDYQTVDPSLGAQGIAGPYKRLPELYLTMVSPERNWRPTFRLYTDTTYFDRSLGVVGARIDARPSVYLPIRTPGAFFIPTVELRYTQYFLDENPTGSAHPSRAVPAASVDAGVVLEREWQIGNDSLLQTLEPRLYYLFVPESEQDDLPLFDTGLYEFSYAQIFRNDRFGGYDRVGDTHQISYGLRSRMIDNRTGFERLRLGLGQIYYLADRDVTLPGTADETHEYSEFVAEAVARLTREWSVGGAVQWDPETEETKKGALRLRYRGGTGPTVNIDYRIRSALTDVEQTDISFRWPVSRAMSVIGRWNYSFEEDSTLEVVGGVEYNTCCWGVRAAARRFLSTTNRAFDTGIFLQVELKGLAGFGRQTESFVKKTVPGYEPEF